MNMNKTILSTEVSVALTFGVNVPEGMTLPRYVSGHHLQHLVPTVVAHSFDVDTLAKFAAVVCMEELADNPVLVWGPPGSGKSSLVAQFCARLNRPLIRVDCHADMDARDLLGGLRLVDGETVPQPGPVAVAAQLGAICLLEEVDRLRPETLVGLNGVLNGDAVRLPEDPGTIYQRAPGFAIIMTANTNLARDPQARYVSNSHDISLRDRVFPIHVSYMSEAQEIATILEQVPLLANGGETEVAKMVKLARALRGGFVAGETSFVISTRTLVRWARSLTIFVGSANRLGVPPLLYALNASFADGLDEEERTMLFEGYRTVIGDQDGRFQEAVRKLGRTTYEGA